ncbi:hypothetical protein [Aquimarina sp. 2201CG14-23]|uniref:hypothetical protein n=1 Tax=Aquimarina mycalae TaxID=3040073 RepID=UPI0024782AB4|nr:hypothetical protein [Aquimarina sp. 2201CG14-23]MDH7447422.1 hypothetical protein [Aquimarina sp. 2201CG14-23]
MKNLIYVILIIAPIYIQAQDSTKVETPTIITKLKAGNSLDFESKSIKFIQVVEDSRCPSDVTCVWAGQAKVLIGLYENNILLEEKEIVMGAKAITPTNSKILFKSGTQSIYGYHLSPYPSSSQKIDPSDYYLELLVK